MASGLGKNLMLHLQAPVCLLAQAACSHRLGQRHELAVTVAVDR